MRKPVARFSRFLEDLRILHPQADQRVDREETPIVHLVRAGFPVRQPVVLLADDFIQPIDAAGVAGVAVDQFQMRQERALYRRARTRGRSDLALQLVARRAGNRALVAAGQGAKRPRDILQRHPGIGGAGRIPRRAREDFGIGPR
jgi:hypothetical protein